jgi:hypothetical protein
MLLPMRQTHKRLLLILGIILVVSGWGTTRYADARQQGLRDSSRDKAWRGDGEYVSGTWLYTIGIVVMAGGAVVVVFNRD